MDKIRINNMINLKEQDLQDQLIKMMVQVQVKTMEMELQIKFHQKMVYRKIKFQVLLIKKIIKSHEVLVLL